MPSPPVRSPRRSHRLAMDRCRALVGALTASARSVEHQTGLTNAQLFVLRTVAAEPGITAGTLARRIDSRPNALTPVLRRLEGARLLRRRADPADARRSRFEITPVGQRRLFGAPPPPAERLLAALRALPPRRLEALSRGLGALLRELEVEGVGTSLLFEVGDA